MKNFNIDDVGILTKTILSGLPGVGKSFLANELSKKFFEDTGITLESVSSDVKFREIRKNSTHPVVINFMKSHNIPQEDFPLLIKTSEFIKKYGEPCFRDLESDVIINMLENEEFNGKVPDLGGKAVLHPRTAEALKKHGYNIVYLKSNINVIVQHVVHDFEKSLDGEHIARSNINDEILHDITKTTPRIARMTPLSFLIYRQNRLKKIMQKRNTLRSKKCKDEVYLFWKRIEARNASALKIMTRMHNERNKLYEKYADVVVDIVGIKDTDINSLLKVIKNPTNNPTVNMSKIINNNKRCYN